MINAPPPACYQTIDKDERRGVASVFSDDAMMTEKKLWEAFSRLRSTPFSVFKASPKEQSYSVPPPQAKRTMRVKLKFIGEGLLMPIDHDLED